MAKNYCYNVEYSMGNDQWFMWDKGISTMKEAKKELANCRQFHVNRVDVRILKVSTKE